MASVAPRILTETLMREASSQVRLGEWWVTLSQSDRFVQWRLLSKEQRTMITEFMREVSDAEGE
jgi:hypothetical protein